MINNDFINRFKVLVKIDPNQAVSELNDLPNDEILNLINTLSIEYFINFISSLKSDAATSILKLLPENYKFEILNSLNASQRKNITELIHYEPNTAGSIMAKEYYSIPFNSSIKDAINNLRLNLSKNIYAISYIYVVDNNDRLEGVIQIRDLIFYPENTPIKNILKSPVVQVETEMPLNDIARLLQRHRYLGLPVVNKEQKLVGVINADAVMQAQEAETSDDIAKIIGTSAEELKTHSVKKIIKLRLPWLFFNIVSGLLCAYISGFFQNDVKILTIMFIFVPVVLGLSESTGVQSATIIVRNLTIGNFQFNNIKSILLKESYAGIFIGTLCGSIIGLFAYIWLNHSLVGLAIFTSMTIVIIISAIIGMLMPLILKKINIDPAIASGPFTLAVCDIQTLIIYFYISNIILKI